MWLFSSPYKYRVQNGEIFMRDNLEVLQSEFNRMNLIPVADAAKKAKLTYNGMKNRVKDGKEMSLVIGSQVFVSV